MNVEHMNKLREQLSRLEPKKFFMGNWIVHPETGGDRDRWWVGPMAARAIRECGTIGCIAGWCSLLNGGPLDEDQSLMPKEFAQDWLGLEENEADALFYGYWSEKEQEEITLPEAIAELDRLIESAPIFQVS